MEEVTQLCINSPESIIGIVSMVIAGASTLANFVPAPDKIKNKALKILSKLVHFAAFDITTAAKK